MTEPEHPPMPPTRARRDSRPVRLLGVLLLVAVGWTAWIWRDSARGAEVVVYCAQDQILAEPILRRFSEATGIRVRPVFDSEAVKTVGLANRLLAEQRYPVADVFWGNEEFRTRQLERRAVWSSDPGWRAFGSRSRILVIHPDHVPAAAAPRSVLELTNAAWRGRVSIAYPLFGTTATHLLALRQAWGAEAFARWADGLRANRPFVEEGNSHVVRRVARGEAWVGLTDSDDLAAALREGLRVAGIPPGPDMLRIPNTVALVRNGPNPAAARKLFDHLTCGEVASALVEAGGLDRADLESGTGLLPDWEDLLDDMEAGIRDLETLFPR